MLPGDAVSSVRRFDRLAAKPEHPSPAKEASTFRSLPQKWDKRKLAGSPNRWYSLDVVSEGQGHEKNRAARLHAGIAQMAERRFRTAQAFGSTPNSSSSALLVTLTFVWLVHDSTAISVRDTAGYTRYSTDVGLAAMMRRGGIYVDVA